LEKQETRNSHKHEPCDISPQVFAKLLRFPGTDSLVLFYGRSHGPKSGGIAEAFHQFGEGIVFFGMNITCQQPLLESASVDMVRRRTMHPGEPERGFLPDSVSRLVHGGIVIH
jgi:hypothetical protein